MTKLKYGQNTRAREGRGESHSSMLFSVLSTRCVSSESRVCACTHVLLALMFLDEVSDDSQSSPNCWVMRLRIQLIRICKLTHLVSNLILLTPAYNID